MKQDVTGKKELAALKDAPSPELEGELVPVDDLKNFVKAALIKSDNCEEKWLYCESEAKAAVASQPSGRSDEKDLIAYA